MYFQGGIKLREKKHVLIGIDDFKELRDLNGYYIDKTKLIMGLIDKPNKVSFVFQTKTLWKDTEYEYVKILF